MFFKWADPYNTAFDFACLPYISGLTELLTSLLLNTGIQGVTNKPRRTFQQGTLPQELYSKIYFTEIQTTQLP